VLTLGMYCLLHTVVFLPVQYSWCCQVLKVPQYHGVYRTTVSTLFHYFVVRTVLMVMSSTRSATVPWRLPYNSPTTVLLFHPALSWRIVQHSQYFLLWSFPCILQEASFLMSCELGLLFLVFYLTSSSFCSAFLLGRL
jgi:hypothetical protein